MKYQVLFSLKNNEKIFRNVVCYSRDWCFNFQSDTISCNVCRFQDNQETLIIYDL